MKLFNRPLNFTIIVLVLIFVSCQNEEAVKKGDTDLTYIPADMRTSSFITPPFIERDIRQEVFMIDAQKDEEIVTESGSKIKIYKNTIVGVDGEIVTGAIKIEYRDFHNPLEIYLSGIPMNYDSAGVKYTFETAGMFELKAYQKDKMLKLKEGKKMDVELTSTSNETDFNFYKFNESTGVWTNEESSMKIITQAKNKGEFKVLTKEMVKPIIQNSTNYTFEIVVNKEQYPELNAYEGTIFEIKDKEDFDPIYYNVQWDKAEIDKTSKNNYTLKLFKEDTSVVVGVNPVIKSKNYKTAITKYNKEVEKREKAKTEKSDFDIYASSTIVYNSSMSAQATISRQLSVNGFGFYNCDRPGIFLPKGNIKELIVMAEGDIQRIKNANFSVVDLQRNAVISVYGKPKYYRGRETVLWTILNEKEMVIVLPRQINTMVEDKVLRARIYTIQEGLEILSDVVAFN